MSQDISNKKRIAKNTVMLYIRMLLSTIVSLYTSRVVLQTLGVEDYGVYGVVGGVVSMFSFLNSSMSGATSRFITYEMGRKNFKRLQDTFSSSVIVHIIIFIIVFLLSETLGLWFLKNKLVIPEDRMFAANIVYQLSVISMFFTITQVPYNALIIAHEKMDVYAYVELLNVFLKLGIVFLLKIGNFDKLTLYAVLTLVVSIIVAVTYRIYCLKKFQEASFHFIWDKTILKPMFSFSGWDLYGNMSLVVFSQGISMLLNVFFGPLLNAANNVSMAVQGTIKGFAYNVVQAFRPQIIKQYAQNNIDEVNNYCILATQYTLILFSIIAVPVFSNVDFILKIWLDVVPDYSSIFLKIVIIGTLFNLANNVVFIPIHATGRIKLSSFVTGTGWLVSLLIMYIVLKMGASAQFSYLVFPFSHLLCLISSLILLKRNIPHFKILQLLLNGYLKPFLAVSPGVIVCVLLQTLNLSDWAILALSILLSTLLIIAGFLFVILDKTGRKKFFLLVKNKILITYGKISQ